MNNEKDTTELIEKYLDNTLTGTERSAFEQKLKEDPSLVQAMEIHRVVNDLIIDRGLLDLKQKMKTGNFERNTGNNRKPYIIIGAIALIGVSAICFFTQKSEENSVSVTPVNQDSIEQKSAKNTTGKDITEDKPAKNKLISHHQKSEKIILKNENGNTEPLPEKSDNIPAIVPQAAQSIHVAPLTENNKQVEVQDAKDPKTESDHAIVKTITINKLPENKTTQLPEQSNEYLFNPSMGQLWEFPIQPGDNCDLKIINRAGEVVFKSIINNGYPNAWNGTSTNGLEVSMGTYLYFITYPDGKISKGFVTVSK